MKKRALISVSDKTGIIELAQGFLEHDIEIISTGGTYHYLTDHGIKALPIEEVTSFPEMLDGRVKTLHPMIHGGLLARRDLPAHQESLHAHQIQPIDFVCVNLYPFKETLLRADTTLNKAIEMIDIGGPSMLRSAAKNYQFVTTLIDPADYSIVLTELTQQAATSLETRQKLAAKVFRHTAAYDTLIGNYLTEIVGEKDPEYLNLAYERQQLLRYGENNHQHATFYRSQLPVPYALTNAQQLHGKELSYNNIRDADSALRIVKEFEEPAVVAVKHMNPCGVGVGETIAVAYQQAYDADPVSIFGGIIAFNREVTSEIAKKLHELFLEIIIAPKFSENARQILTQKKNLRLVELAMSENNHDSTSEYTSVLGGLLVQEQDQVEEQPANWEVVTEKRPTPEQLQALEFAYKVVKHVKSNAIVVANAQQTLGIGAGQMNRIGSVKIALKQAGAQSANAVLASDAFFPMDDCVAYAAEQGIQAIIQPGGSIKDQASIDKANEHGIAMVFTNVRHFRH